MSSMHPVTSRALAFMAPMAMVLAMGCSRNAAPADAECSTDSSCDAGFHCSGAKKCVQQCDPTTSEKSCEQGQSCTPQGRCVDSMVSCSIAADCDLDAEIVSRCDGETSVEEAVIGRCIEVSEGEGKMCRYDDRRTPCLDGCNQETGKCIPGTPDPCDDVVCDEPPQNTCKDANTQTRYPNEGTCNEGMCSYQASESNCPNGCEGGSCNPGICEDDTCNDAMPPEPTCSSADPRIAIAAMGDPTCIEEMGSPRCEFDVVETHCAYVGATCNAGACEGVVAQSGEAVITEYMVSPTQGGQTRSGSQWIEVANTTGAALDLAGWTLTFEDEQNGTSSHTITALTIPAGERALLSNGGDPLLDGATAPDYQYADVVLRFDGALTLSKPGGDVSDFLFWERGATILSHARQLSPGATLSAAGNDDPDAWCPNLTDAIGDNFGTPKAANAACVGSPCDVFACNAPAAYCDSNGDAVAPTNPGAMCQVSRYNNPFCDFAPMTTQCSATSMCVDGVCQDLPMNLPTAGQIVITELMGNPTGSDDDLEWLELHNTTDAELSIFSLKIEDNEQGGSFTTMSIDDMSAKIPARGYAVMAVNQDSATNGNLVGTYPLVKGLLKNTPAVDMAGESTMKVRLVLSDGTLIDEAYYGVPVEGKSQQLSASSYVGGSGGAQANDGPASFCEATVDYDAAAGAGSPGADNEECAP